VQHGSSYGEPQVHCKGCGCREALSYGTAYDSCCATSAWLSYRISVACLDQWSAIEYLFLHWDEFHTAVEGHYPLETFTRIVTLLSNSEFHSYETDRSAQRNLTGILGQPWT